MIRQIAIPVLLVSAVVLGSCGGSPQGPGRLPEPPTVPVTLVPPAPPPANNNPAAGMYALTVAVGSACAAIPEAERTRRYTARLDDDGPGRYVVTLSDASFLSGPVCTMAGLDCNQFRALEEGEAMEFLLENNSEWHGGYITEKTPSGWVAITGAAAGRRAGSSIEATGSTSAWYCPASGYPYPCNGIAFCKADLRLSLTKR